MRWSPRSMRSIPRSTSSWSTTGRATRLLRAAAAAGAAVVRLPFNLGIGAAVQTGFRYALEQEYDVAVRLDGDGQHDPAELPKLLEPLERDEADVVTGSRFRRGRGRLPAAARRAASGSRGSPGSSRCSRDSG